MVRQCVTGHNGAARDRANVNRLIDLLSSLSTEFYGAGIVWRTSSSWLAGFVAAAASKESANRPPRDLRARCTIWILRLNNSTRSIVECIDMYGI